MQAVGKSSGVGFGDSTEGFIWTGREDIGVSSCQRRVLLFVNMVVLLALKWIQIYYSDRKLLRLSTLFIALRNLWYSWMSLGKCGHDTGVMTRMNYSVHYRTNRQQPFLMERWALMNSILFLSPLTRYGVYRQTPTKSRPSPFVSSSQKENMVEWALPARLKSLLHACRQSTTDCVHMCARLVGDILDALSSLFSFVGKDEGPKSEL